MSRKIVVLANCQTGGLAASLGLMSPGDDIRPVSWNPAPEALKRAAEDAAGADLVVTSIPANVEATLRTEHGYRPAATLKIPSLFFTGFHPDLTIAYVEGKPINLIGHSPYQSAIGLWCWKNDVSIARAMRLFTPSVMERMGYSRSWGAAMQRARLEFEPTPLSFADVFLPLQASGEVFMHTLNHPRINAVAQLARVIAREIGCDARLIEQPVERMVPDALAHSDAWPVYPGVAEHLGLRPDRVWRIHGGYYDLEGYLTLQYDALSRQTGPIHCPKTDNLAFDGLIRPLVQS